MKPPLGDIAGLGTGYRGLADLSNKSAPKSESEPEDRPALPSDEEGCASVSSSVK